MKDHETEIGANKHRRDYCQECTYSVVPVSACRALILRHIHTRGHSKSADANTNANTVMNRATSRVLWEYANQVIAEPSGQLRKAASARLDIKGMKKPMRKRAATEDSATVNAVPEVVTFDFSLHLGGRNGINIAKPSCDNKTRGDISHHSIATPTNAVPAAAS